MKKRLFIAGTSLVIALVMLATASFAWFSLSVSPEVSGMQMAVYSDRTLLLAPDNHGEPGSFNQYISLSDGFAGLAPLRPVSTVDGINWFLPAYDTATGDIADPSEFVLDAGLEHANVSIVDASGNPLTGEALSEAVNKGYFVYTDFWMKTEEDGAKVRLSIPRTYGSVTDRHAGTTGEYALDSEELTQAVYGTYVLGEPELALSSEAQLAERTEAPETALRVGFLIFQDPETKEALELDAESIPFKVYEPNADRRAAGEDGMRVMVADDASENVLIEKDDYIAGGTGQTLTEGTYYVTEGIAKGSDGKGTLQAIPWEDLIIQCKSSWNDESVLKAMTGQWGDSVTRASSNDVEVFGEFLTPQSGYSTTGASYVTSEAEKTYASSVLLELKKNTPIRVRLFVWLEGQDVDCWNDIATGTFRINLELAGETVYDDAEEEEGGDVSEES